jgi:hypothetical protein
MFLQSRTPQQLSDDEIRQKIEEVVGRPEFQLDSAIDPDAIGLWFRLLLWMLRPIIWLFEALDGLPNALRWVIVVVLMMVLVMLIAHIIWSFVAAVRGTPRRAVAGLVKAPDVMPEDLEQAAEEAVGAGDYITAARVLFLASLLRVERAEKKTLRRGVTNRELLRRYRNSPLFEPLARFVEIIEMKWYGHAVCDASDYEGCRAQYAQIIDVLERRSETKMSATMIDGVKSNAVGA